MKSFQLVILFLLSGLFSYSQQVTGKWIKIYEAGNTKLEIQYTTDDNVCINGNPNSFYYKISGEKKTTGLSYVTFKMNYYNCNGNLKFEQFSINIGTSSSAKLNIKALDIDFVFAGKLDKAYYDVHETLEVERNSGEVTENYALEPEKKSPPLKISKDKYIYIAKRDLSITDCWLWVSPYFDMETIYNIPKGAQIFVLKEDIVTQMSAKFSYIYCDGYYGYLEQYLVKKIVNE